MDIKIIFKELFENSFFDFAKKNNIDNNISFETKITRFAYCNYLRKYHVNNKSEIIINFIKEISEKVDTFLTMNLDFRYLGEKSHYKITIDFSKKLNIIVELVNPIKYIFKKSVTQRHKLLDIINNDKSVCKQL